MELAFTGAFAWAAWQTLGRLQRHVSKIEKNIDDGRLLGEWDRECKVLAVSLVVRVKSSITGHICANDLAMPSGQT